MIVAQGIGCDNGARPGRENGAELNRLFLSELVERGLDFAN